jgi:hypothetical protein
VITWLVNHSVLAGFNLINSRLDAYRILRHKQIAHGINFGAYMALVLFLVYLQACKQWPLDGIDWVYFILEAVNFLLSALCNRQLSFDIPLNLRRGLKWDYQSVANPPKAIMDKIERWFFGNLEGKYIAGIYAVAFLLFTVKEVFYQWPIF